MNPAGRSCYLLLRVCWTVFPEGWPRFHRWVCCQVLPLFFPASAVICSHLTKKKKRKTEANIITQSPMQYWWGKQREWRLGRAHNFTSQIESERKKNSFTQPASTNWSMKTSVGSHLTLCVWQSVLQFHFRSDFISACVVAGDNRVNKELLIHLI